MIQLPADSGRAAWADVSGRFRANRRGGAVRASIVKGRGMADLYKVVVKGKPILGWARADVVENLAKLMKIHPDKANDLLKGEALTVKQNVEQFQAEKLMGVFRAAGVDCEMVKLAAPVPAKKAPPRPANTMECPKCGHVQEKGLSECGECGVLFAKLEAIAEAERLAKEAAAAPKPHFMEDLGHFIGPHQDYYFKQVELFRQRQGAFAWTWNWSAFLAGFWWFLYRKMPLAAAIAFIGLCIPGVQILVWIALGGAANYIYFQQAKRRIARLRETHPTGDLREHLAAAGGVSRRAAQLAIGLSVVITVLAVALPFYLRYRVVQQLEHIPRTAILRPTFQTAEGFREGGTACVVEVPEYERYMLLTTHHFFGPMGGFEKTYAWNEIRALVHQVNATTPTDLALVVSTKEVLQIPNAAAYNGQNVNRDLAVFPLPDKPPVPVFRLSVDLPQSGDRVWLLAFATAAAATEKVVHGATVLQAADNAIILKFDDAGLDITGAGGAPVLNGDGVLVGLLVTGARQNNLLYGYANPASQIRLLIEEGFKL